MLVDRELRRIFSERKRWWVVPPPPPPPQAHEALAAEAVAFPEVGEDCGDA